MFKLNEDFDAHNGNKQTVMEINGLQCVLNMPKALKSKFTDGVEVALGLPPYAPRRAFKVDDYHCPVNWMHGSSLSNSYFVPVAGEHGMWLDFNNNFNVSNRDVAILISIQGVNPLDGQSMVDEAMHLKQYKSKCPVHDLDFKADRFCEKCGYKWVPQNYLCTTGTPYGRLWLDGFLAADGVVRQYYFTEEEVKGIAHQIIGPEKKVYSIGIAFYLSKEPKPTNVYSRSNMVFNTIHNSCYGGTDLYGGLEAYSVTVSVDAANHKTSTGQHTNSTVRRKTGAGGQSVNAMPDIDHYSSEPVRTLEIGAGCKIDQKVYADPKELDYWEDKPAGILYINYTPFQEAISILEKGKKDLTKSGEGFLAGLNSGK